MLLQIGGSTETVYNFQISDNSGKTTTKGIRLEQSTPQTIIVDVSDWTGTNINMRPDPSLNNYQVKYTVKSVKAIYK